MPGRDNRGPPTCSNNGHMQGKPLSQPFSGLGERTETTEDCCAQRGEVICLEMMQDQAWLFPASISRPHPPHPGSQTPQRTPPHRARGLPPGAGRPATGPHRRPGRRRPGFSCTRAATTPGDRVSLPGAEPNGAQRLQASCARRPWTPWGCPARWSAQPSVRGPLEGRPGPGEGSDPGSGPGASRGRQRAWRRPPTLLTSLSCSISLRMAS